MGNVPLHWERPCMSRGRSYMGNLYLPLNFAVNLRLLQKHLSHKREKISKYFRRYILHSNTDKGLVSKIYKDFLQISKKKVNNLMEKMGKSYEQASHR